MKTSYIRNSHNKTKKKTHQKKPVPTGNNNTLKKIKAYKKKYKAQYGGDNACIIWNDLQTKDNEGLFYWKSIKMIGSDEYLVYVTSILEDAIGMWITSLTKLHTCKTDIDHANVIGKFKTMTGTGIRLHLVRSAARNIGGPLCQYWA